MQGTGALDKHRQVLGILYMAFGGLLALGAVVVLAMFVFGAQPSSEEARASALRVSGAVAAFLLLLALPDLIGGIGLLRRLVDDKARHISMGLDETGDVFMIIIRGR